MANQIEITAYGLGIEITNVNKSNFGEIVEKFNGDRVNNAFFFTFKGMGMRGYHEVIEAAMMLGGSWQGR